MLVHSKSNSMCYSESHLGDEQTGPQTSFWTDIMLVFDLAVVTKQRISHVIS